MGPRRGQISCPTLALGPGQVRHFEVVRRANDSNMPPRPPCGIQSAIRPSTFLPAGWPPRQPPGAPGPLTMQENYVSSGQVSFATGNEGMNLGCLWVKGGQVAEGQRNPAALARAACRTSSFLG